MEAASQSGSAQQTQRQSRAGSLGLSQTPPPTSLTPPTPHRPAADQLPPAHTLNNHILLRETPPGILPSPTRVQSPEARALCPHPRLVPGCTPALMVPLPPPRSLGTPMAPKGHTGCPSALPKLALPVGAFLLPLRVCPVDFGDQPPEKADGPTGDCG